MNLQFHIKNRWYIKLPAQQKEFLALTNKRLLPFSHGRVFGLDVLRSIAILLVMHEHGNSLLPPRVAKYLMLPIPSIDGVSVFFVLSGFLIGRILLKIVNTAEFKGQDILNFWVQRWLRTIPNYYLVILILLVCQFLISKNAQINYRYFIFSQNLYEPNPLFFPEGWSLSVEEWFYLLFPIVIFLIFVTFKNKKESIIAAAIIFLVIPVFLRIATYCQSGDVAWDLNFRKIVILRLDSIMYGVIGAYIFTFKNSFWKKAKQIGLISSGVITAFLILYSGASKEKQIFDCIYHFNLQSLSVLCCLPFFSTLKTIKHKKIVNAFTFISLISYSMYLINLSLVRDIAVPSIIKFVGLHYGSNIFLNTFSHFLQFSLFWFLTIFLSYFLFIYVEIPIMNFRKRLKS